MLWRGLVRGDPRASGPLRPRLPDEQFRPMLVVQRGQFEPLTGQDRPVGIELLVEQIRAGIAISSFT